MSGRSVPSPEGDLERLERSLQTPAVPASLQRIIESYIEKKTGKVWDDPVVLERIRAAILAQKSSYWREGEGRQIQYRTGYSVLAYLGYQMPVYFAQFQHILLLLLREGLFKDDVKILDVGTGPGVVPLAVIDFLRRRGRGTATVYTIESSEEHLEAYRFLVPAFGGETPGVRIEPPIAADLTTLTPSALPRDIDLLVFSNVLNEMPVATTEERASILLRYATVLRPDGTLILTEPADRANSTALRRIVLAASTGTDALTLYAPCTFLWGRRCGVEQCWSFVEYGTIDPPELMQALSQGKEGYRFRNTDVKTSIALLRKDDRIRCPLPAMQGRRALPFDHLSRHVGKVVNVMAGIMSGDIGDRSYRVILLCDGTSVTPVYAMVPRYLEGKLHALSGARYGDLIALDQVLVRYNPAHGAFNLLVTARSRVRALAPSRPDE